MKYNCDLCGSYYNNLNRVSIYPKYFPEPLRNKYSSSLYCNDCFQYVSKDSDFGKDFFIYNMHIKEVMKNKIEFLKGSIFKINPEIELTEVFDNSIYYNFKFFIVSQMIKYLSYSIKKLNTKYITDDNFYLIKRNFLSGNIIDKHQILMWKNPGYSEFRMPILHQVNTTKAIIFHYSFYIIVVNINMFEGFDVEYKEILVNRLKFKCNVISQGNYLNVLNKYSGILDESLLLKKRLNFYDNKYS
ncbi:MAG: hypothetical protein K2X69_00970 [Silvanigrellaceae bacterium]|nr:hypothetical protein [Silvanigrellaceae bacterium]